MRVSVVICTYNRRQSLLDTLEALKYQSYGDFEVVVVNGPSTDGTAEALEPWRGRVKLTTNPLANLSVSRNIGINASAGDIVAFIDDDALPEFDWLQQALPHFADAEVAGVGGIVFDHTGLALQYRYSAANRFAETSTRDDRPFDDQSFPGSFEFPYLQGTNALFRRDALNRVSGFDETYEYYLDETDLCCRLVDAGFVLRQLPDAAIHHKFLPSGIRDHQRVVTNWFPIMKNQVYFSYRHALGAFSEYDILDHSRAFLEQRVADARIHEEAGRLPPESANRCAVMCAEALATGISLGREGVHRRLPPLDQNRTEFRRFETVDSSSRRKITMVSSGFRPNLTGGIARFFSDLAPALAARGHEVRVITRATGPAAVDLEGGVWVHRIDPASADAGVLDDAPPPVDGFATAVLREVERIGGWSSHDIVYGPLWDVEVLALVRHTALPVAVHVATPLAVATGMAGHRDDPASAGAIAQLVELERELLATADLFHANGRAVVSTIGEVQPGSVVLDRWGIVPLGMHDESEHTERAARSSRSGPVTVVFVGRFEARKGIDSVFEVIERLLPQMPDLRFTLVGEDRPLRPGEAPAGQAWRDMHAASAWFDRVEFTGPAPDDELHRRYASADIALLPSRYESFGLVMVEAMMHGLPVVSCAAGGVVDVVTDGVDGLLVPPGDTDALTDAVRRLVIDRSLRLRMGAAGRSSFERAFGVARSAERFEALLTRVWSEEAPIGPGHRGSDGCLWHRIGAGDSFTVRSDRRGAARLCLRSSAPALVTIEEEPRRILQIEPGRVTRVDLPPKGSVLVMVNSGTIDVGGVCTTLPEGESRDDTDQREAQ
jgi:glycogen(starch) synthase